MAVSFDLDYSYLMSDNLGRKHGLTEAQLDALQPSLASALRKLKADVVRGEHQKFGFLDLPDTMGAAIGRLNEAADELSEAADVHLILGIGGSYLGAQMLFDSLCHNFHNELDRRRRSRRPRIYFEGNGLDNDSFSDLLDFLGDEPITAHVISKSGTTLETAVAFRFLRARCNVRLWAATTDPDPEHGFLRPQCEALGAPDRLIFDLPPNVGGRYSVLTPVGLLPAAVMGLDIERLLAGAGWMRDRCEVADWRHNPACLYAAAQHLSEQAGRDVSVLAVWDKALESLGLWLDQLQAESLGKQEKGRTPMTAVCTRELHSRGQQHQQGARNKVITNLVLDRPRRVPVSVPPNSDDPAKGLDELTYIAERPMDELNLAAYQATDAAYFKDRRPGMTITLGTMDEEHVGALIMFFEIATVIEAHLMKVNPLDQPGVQAYKDLLTGLLGKPGAEQFRDEFDQIQENKHVHRLRL